MSCLAVITVFIFLLNYLTFQSDSKPMLLAVDSIYIAACYAYFLLFTGRVGAGVFERVMLVFSILGTTISLYVVWVVASLAGL